MSLIMKKRENEKQRMNGLNDPGKLNYLCSAILSNCSIIFSLVSHFKWCKCRRTLIAPLPTNGQLHRMKLQWHKRCIKHLYNQWQWNSSRRCLRTTRKAHLSFNRKKLRSSRFYSNRFCTCVRTRRKRKPWMVRLQPGQFRRLLRCITIWKNLENLSSSTENCHQELIMVKSRKLLVADCELFLFSSIDPPTYIDPATGNPIIYQSQSPTTAITPADESNQAEQSSCNCSNCQNIMKTNWKLWWRSFHLTCTIVIKS